MELNWAKKSRADAYTDVSFETHPDFNITPTNLKGASNIQITCKNTNAQSAQLLIKADGEIVGALNVFYPEPKSINLKWYFVELEGDKKDYEILKSKIDRVH